MGKRWIEKAEHCLEDRPRGYGGDVRRRQRVVVTELRVFGKHRATRLKLRSGDNTGWIIEVCHN